jgi:ribonuclease J
MIEVPLGGHDRPGTVPGRPDHHDPFDCRAERPEAITTPLGTVLHTGDWKIDEIPSSARSTDIAAISRLGDDGVLAMVCDSTNVFVEGSAGSELGVPGRPDRADRR